MDIDEINEMFPDELLSDAEFEKALDALCANPDDDVSNNLFKLISNCISIIILFSSNERSQN